MHIQYNYEKVEISKSEPTKFSFLCTLTLKGMCEWQSLKSEKNPALLMISLKLCDEMELVLEFAFSTIRLNAIPSTSYFKKWQKSDQKHLQHSTST
jgi:hypothetical protein